MYSIFGYIGFTYTRVFIFVYFVIFIFNTGSNPNIFYIIRQCISITISLLYCLLKLCFTYFLFFTFNNNIWLCTFIVFIYNNISFFRSTTHFYRLIQFDPFRFITIIKYQFQVCFSLYYFFWIRVITRLLPFTEISYQLTIFTYLYQSLLCTLIY